MDNQNIFEKYILARMLWWQSVIDEMSAEATASVITTIETVQKEVSSLLTSDIPDLMELQGWERAQDAAFNAWAEETLAGAKASISGVISEAAVDAANSSLMAYSAILSLDGLATNVQTVGLSTAQILAWFQDTPLGNAGLEDWVNNAFARGIQDRLLAALRVSGVRGEGTADAVARLLLTASDAGFELTKRDAISVTRTFIQTANVNAQEAVYEANRGLLKGYKRVETLDSGTCLQCALADGSEYALDEKRPRLPSHPRCRGIWSPICKSWADFGFSVEELERVARPWTIREQGNIDTGGLKIENYGKTTENFSGWWKSLPAKDKERTSIGPIRRKLLESGRVQWDELWDKATGLPKTLKELGYNMLGDPL